MAARAGDVLLSMRAAEEIANHFTVDIDEMKATALGDGRSPERGSSGPSGCGGAGPGARG